MGIVLCMSPANERLCYNVTVSHWLGAYDRMIPVLVTQASADLLVDCKHEAEICVLGFMEEYLTWDLETVCWRYSLGCINGSWRILLDQWIYITNMISVLWPTVPQICWPDIGNSMNLWLEMRLKFDVACFAKANVLVPVSLHIVAYFNNIRRNIRSLLVHFMAWCLISNQYFDGSNHWHNLWELTCMMI